MQSASFGVQNILGRMLDKWFLAKHGDSLGLAGRIEQIDCGDVLGNMGSICPYRTNGIGLDFVGFLSVGQ
uniref:Uncharacterized protein n=1 Tax=Romanomermis culicivorax TaxID=13658 RepID=A0A915JNX2_ROMCU